MVFGGQQESLVQSVSVPMPEAIQAVKQGEVVFSGWQDRSSSHYTPTEFGSLCMHAIDVTEDSIEAVQDLTSEGQANKSETWPVKVKQTSEGDLTSEGWAIEWRRLDPEECGKSNICKVKHANER